MAQNIPKNHHFVPQFILRNYSDDGIMINIFDLEKQEVASKNMEFQFRKRNMYKDPNNEDVMYVEKRFAELETKASEILKEFVESKQRVEINRVQLNTLKKFFFLMEFRSKRRRSQYFDNQFDDLTRVVLDRHTTNGDYVGLWHRELKYILDTDVDRIKENENLTWMIAADFFSSHKFTFIVCWDAYQGEEFVVTDNYGTFEWSQNGMTKVIHFYPLSPRRMIGFVNKSYEVDKLGTWAPSLFSRSLFEFPKNKKDDWNKYQDSDRFVYKILRAPNNDVRYANTLLMNETWEKLCFHNKDKVTRSVEEYMNNEKTRKKDYSGFFQMCDRI